MCAIAGATETPAECKERHGRNLVLSTLPDELILIIIEDLSIHSLNALIQTCRRLQSLLTPRLYNLALCYYHHSVYNVSWALTVGARTNNLTIIQQVLQYGAPHPDHIKRYWSGALLEAAEYGHDNVVRFLLELGISPHGTSNYTRPLWRAARHNHAKVVETLLDAGVKISSPCPMAHCPLIAAALEYKGDRATVELLVRRGAFRGAVNHDDETVLHRLASSGAVEMIGFFLGLGDPIDPLSSGGITPLGCAIRTQPRPVVSYLLSRGASVSVLETRASAIHLALQNPSADGPSIIELLLEHGADVNKRCARSDMTPLHQAVLFSTRATLPTINLLLRYGADVNAQAGVQMDTPLHRALMKPSESTLSLVALLLEHGANPNAAALGCETPLRLVSSEPGDNRPLIKLLLDAGAHHDVGCEPSSATLRAALSSHFSSIPASLLLQSRELTNVEYTSKLLIWAVSQNNEGLVRLLFAHGATPHKAIAVLALETAAPRGREEVLKFLLTRLHSAASMHSSTGSTPLIQAASLGGPEAVRLLLQHGAPVDAVDCNGARALMKAVKSNDREVVEMLVDRTQDLSATDLGGATALHYAAAGGNVENLALLLERTQDTAAMDHGGQTALHRAAANGKAENVALLLARGLSADQADHDGRTPLLLATLSESVNTVQTLLGHSAVDLDLEVRGWKGDTPLIAACKRKNWRLAETLLDAGANTEARCNEFSLTPLGGACMNGQEELAVQLLDHGADLEAQGRSGRRPLAIAARRGHTGVISLLLDRGAAIDAVDMHLETALIRATLAGQVGAVRELVRRHANVNHYDYYERTALSHAAENGERDLLQILLESGAELDLADRMGRTPLSWAVMGGSLRNIDALIKAGADVARGDKEGRTPVSWATRSTNGEKIIKTLYQRYTG